jgi:hypothetical protein
VISAKPGAFLGLNDCLFTGDHITNVTFSGNNAILRMCKTDYLSAAYPASQWRHVFYLMSCSNITIQNLTARDSGGDGVFIGSFPGQAPCSTITIQSVICDNNARQGMSITNADNLTIDSCQIKNSSGVDPQAGIDFEPDASSQQITRCLVNNCQFVNNAKAGIMVSLQNHIEGCRPEFRRLHGHQRGRLGHPIQVRFRHQRRFRICGIPKLPDPGCSRTRLVYELQGILPDTGLFPAVPVATGRQGGRGRAAGLSHDPGG